jgi:ABC-type multidrug transport system fused ATPase/permease subunit
MWRTLPRALPYMRPYKHLAAIALLVTLFGAIVALAEPWPLAIMIDSVLGSKGTPSMLTPIFGSHPDKYALLIFAASLGFVITVFGSGLTVIAEYVTTKLDQRMVLDLRSDLFEHVQRLSLTFHDSTLTGQLMQRINLQANALGTILTAFAPLIQSALTLVGMFVIAFLIDWQVALVSLVAVPFIYYALGLYGTRIVPYVQKVMGLEMRSMSIVHEAMGMLRVIVSFGRESYEHRRFRSQAETAVDARVKLTVRQTIFGLAVTAATAAGTGLVLGFGAWHVLQGKITIGEMTVLISYIAAVYQPLEAISNTVGTLHQQFVYFNNSIRLLDTAPEVMEAPEPVRIGRSKGAVTFENVSFAYQGRDDTLKNISFEAKPGQRVAVVGPTGAGKTTLITLLTRFYDPKQGRILIDGVDIRQLTLKSLRNQIGVVLQEPLLFSGSIATNIQYGKLGCGMDDIVAAAKAANAHDFISEFPDGYDTPVGERGAQLSGGERQRISIARAFIKDAPILIMDEPTSSIDSRTESVILDALEQLMAGRTSFLIAHRLATIRDANLILVLDHGEVIEQGTHDELLDRDGLYRQLYDAQHVGRGARAGLKAPTARAELPVGSGDAAAESKTPRQQAIEKALQSGREHLRAVPGGRSENGQAKRPEKVRSKQPPIVKRLGVKPEDVSCDLCGRVLLKGEPVIVFMAPVEGHQKPSKAERKRVCEPCAPTAEDAGWKAPPAIQQREFDAIERARKPHDGPRTSSVTARSRRDG